MSFVKNTPAREHKYIYYELRKERANLRGRNRV